MEFDRAPRLEMLWEAHNPHHALAERFGFDDAAAADRWLRTTLSSHWGVTIESCQRIVMSDHNALAWISTDMGSLLAKWSAAPERFARLSHVADVTQWLADNGLPVSAPVPSLDGRLQLEVDGVSMAVQHVVEGQLLDVGNNRQVHMAGATLAEFHDALGRYPAADETVSQNGTDVPLATRVTGWLDSTDSPAPSAALQALRRIVRDAPRLEGATQLLHGDFRSANVLCSGMSIAAVLDMEEVRRDHCIDELARSTVLLGTRFHDWGPVSAEVHALFRAGYESVRPLTLPEQHWWDVLVLWYTLLFVPADDDPTGWAASALEQAADI
ncbi:homoserine kinase type II [Ruania alba]|uniref:Homoserine kinase type II n=2 Tax=Ruania alba TaxID=648782 RepID=A0A1H5G371_9MICO|nr:homoserine kinase type II [Ruania alba]